MTPDAGARRGPAAIAARAAHGAFAALLAYALFCVFALNVDTADRRGEALPAIAGVAGALPVLVALRLMRARVAAAARAFVGALDAAAPVRFAIATLLLGIALRVAFILAFPPVQSSDGASYLALATRLAAGESYRAAGTLAYWPPGLPFGLLPWILVLGEDRYVPLFHNLLLFVVSSLATARFAARLGGATAGRIAMLALSLWPNLVMDAGMASKEQQLVALVTLALALFPQAGSALPALWSGLALGAAALTQPALLPAPLAFVAWQLLRGDGARRSALRIALLLAGFVAAIAPWTMRNHLVLGGFVPVTSTAGFALYIANNDRAWGGWIDILADGDASLDPRIDERGASREAGRRAAEWIRDNPGRAAFLALRRQQLFLGDDSDGAFSSLKRGLGMSGPGYAAAKLVALGFWLALLAALLFFLVGAWRGRRGMLPRAGMLPLMLFCGLFALHSVVESGARHHVALSGAMAALLGAWMSIAARRAALAPTVTRSGPPG
ncbi:MAG: hypothetical protein ACKOUS_22765 [Alphaproteobacteria bacterium]